MLCKVEHVKWGLDLLIIGQVKSPTISLLSGIPFGMNYPEMSSWFYHGDGMILPMKFTINLT